MGKKAVLEIVGSRNEAENLVAGRAVDARADSMRRTPLLLSLSLVVALGCGHSEPQQHAQSDTVARSPEAAGGEQICGNAQVYFASGSAALDTTATERLDRYATCLSNHEIDVIYVSGTTDPSGTPEENLTLGRARARAAADYLHTRGCEVDFVIRSFGERNALASPPLWPVERSADVTAVATH